MSVKTKWQNIVVTTRGVARQHKAKELEKLQKRQAKILWIILAVNAVMFVLKDTASHMVEFIGGIKAASLSLTGDSLDMLGNALVYGCSLNVIQKGKRVAGAIGNTQKQYHVSNCDRCICQSHLSIICTNRPYS